MTKAHARRLRLNLSSKRNNASIPPDAPAKIARRLKGGTARAEPGGSSDLWFPNSGRLIHYRMLNRGTATRKRRIVTWGRSAILEIGNMVGTTVQPSRIVQRRAVITASMLSRITRGNVDQAIDLLASLAVTQRMIRIAKDIFIIEGLMADLKAPSKTIILLRSFYCPGIEPHTFIRALQVGTLARIMLGTHPIDHRSEEPPIAPDVAADEMPDKGPRNKPKWVRII